MIKNITTLHGIVLLAAGLLLTNNLLVECIGVQQHSNPAADEGLIMATIQGDLEKAKAALDAGADANYVDTYDNTALIEAVKNGHTKIVRMLIEAGADINYANNKGNTALTLAIISRQADMVRLLLEAGADANHIDNETGYTPLMVTIRLLEAAPDESRPQFLETIQLLLEYGARIPSGDDFTKLHPKLDVKEVGRYIGNILKDVFGGNLLAYAAAIGDVKRVAQLLSTLPQTQPQSPKTKSLIAQLHKLLASHAILPPAIPAQPLAINRQDSHGMTALHWAAAQGHDDIVRLLLDHGAHINVQDRDGNTPLHIAVRNGNLSTVKLLVERGARVTLVNRHGETPLALAHRYHRPDIVALLERGAGHAVFGRISTLGRTRGGFAWQPAGQQQPLPPDVARQIAQFALAPGNIPPAGSPS